MVVRSCQTDGGWRRRCDRVRVPQITVVGLDLSTLSIRTVTAARIYRKMIYRIQVCPRGDLPLEVFVLYVACLAVFRSLLLTECLRMLTRFDWCALAIARILGASASFSTRFRPRQSHELNELPRSPQRTSIALPV